MTTVPFTTLEIAQYISGWRPTGVTLADSVLTPSHVMNYLGYMKIEDPVTTITLEQFHAFMISDSHVRCVGLDVLLMHVLYFYRFGTKYPLIDDCIWSDDELSRFCSMYEFTLSEYVRVLSAVPFFLQCKLNVQTATNFATTTAVGVNFVAVFSDPHFLTMWLPPEALSRSADEHEYFTALFDSYVYSGRSLVWFVINNPQNLLFSGMASD